MKISEATRRNIFDAILIEKIYWGGKLSDVDFLKRTFNLEKMVSYDPRFDNAEGDIWQHRGNNYDWEDNWIFYDARFNLLRTDDAIFLKFLCEMLHPLVRENLDEVNHLKEIINDSLRVDGFELVEYEYIAKRPIFRARAYLPTTTISNSMQEMFMKADMNYIMRQIARMETAINEDPDLAIGTAKELVETCCKTILEERKIEFPSELGLSQLVKQTTKELSLTPDDIPNEAKASNTIRKLLHNLASITQSMAELRNHYGTGHGKTARTRGLQPRHARLAAGAASTLVVFLFETHQVRGKGETK